MKVVEFMPLKCAMAYQADIAARLAENELMIENLSPRLDNARGRESQRLFSMMYALVSERNWLLALQDPEKHDRVLFETLRIMNRGRGPGRRFAAYTPQDLIDLGFDAIYKQAVEQTPNSWHQEQDLVNYIIPQIFHAQQMK